MKKILVFLLLAVVLMTSFTSCAEKTKYEDVTYRENGITFVLPNTMKRTSVEGYDFYFFNSVISVMFTATKIDEDFLASFELETGLTVGEYVDILIERRGFEKSKLFYVYDESSDQHNFRYTYVNESGFETFCYITLTGSEDNIWYIEMCCNQEDSGKYLSMFQNWRKTIGTYS